MAGRCIIDLSYLILMSFSPKWNDLKHAISQVDVHIESTNATTAAIVTTITATARLTFNIGFVFNFSPLFPCPLSLYFLLYFFFQSLLLESLTSNSFLSCSFVCSCSENFLSLPRSHFLSFVLSSG